MNRTNAATVKTTFEDLLARDGFLVYKTRGVSMKPMLKQNRDLVVIRTPSSSLKKNDTVLYRRGQSYVLHRIIRVCEDHYLIRGDNTFRLEYVPGTEVIGVLTAFTLKGRHHDVTEKGYLIYVHIWQAIYPFRFIFFHSRCLLARIVRKIRRIIDR